jgi:hypothetical protein
MADDVVGTFEYDLTTGEMTWSSMLYDLHGVAPDTDRPLLAVWADAMQPADKQEACAVFHRGVREGGLFSVRYRMTDATGQQHELVVAAESWGLDGAAYVSGFVIDVTAPLTEHVNQAVAASGQHRAVIEQAKGALMLALGVPEEAAFLALRRLSHSHNIRLGDLADRFLQFLRTAAPTQEPAVAALSRFIDDLETTMVPCRQVDTDTPPQSPEAAPVAG